jgi:hypothetical protein
MRSQRTKIVKALAEKFKEIDGTGNYEANLSQNSFAKLKFWDEVEDFPCVYLTPGQETREYLLSEFVWGILMVSVKVYVRSEDSAQEQLEQLLNDLELCIDNNRQLEYAEGKETTEILIQSITTDEGLLSPYGVGEINLEVRYALG